MNSVHGGGSAPLAAPAVSTGDLIWGENNKDISHRLWKNLTNEMMALQLLLQNSREQMERIC